MRTLITIVIAALSLNAFGQTPESMGADPCSEDCPLQFSDLLPSSVVECEDDLPTSCEAYLLGLGIENLIAVNGCDDNEYPVYCTMLSSNSVSELDGNPSREIFDECEELSIIHI